MTIMGRYLDADPMLLIDGAGEERGGKFHALNAAVVQLVSRRRRRWPDIEQTATDRGTPVGVVSWPKLDKCGVCGASGQRD
jgi:hypothetical protein